MSVGPEGAWDACAAEAVRCGLLSAEEGRILSSRKSEMQWRTGDDE